MTPACNTGVYPPGPQGLIHRFDYYRATVPAHASLVVRMLVEGLGAKGFPVEESAGKGRWSFLHNVHLVDSAGRVLVEVLHGGKNPWPCVEAEGAISPIVADLLRAAGPHRPTRVDPACDMERPGLFQEVRAALFEVCAKHGMKPPRDIDNNDPDQGNTCTVGGRQGVFYLRVYQPGLKRAQEEGRTGDQITQSERDTVRVELEFKPDNDTAREAARTLSASDMWTLSPWVSDVARRVFAMDVKPISIAERRESNRERALRFMCSQYGTHLRSLLNECDGDLHQFGLAIADRAGLLSAEDMRVA